jgi:hypothetical protein
MMGATRLRQTGRCRLALLLLGIVALIVTQTDALTPLVSRRSLSFTDEPRISQRAEDPAPYAIYPKDKANKVQTDAITKLLNELVSDKKSIYASENQYLGIIFWSARLTKAQAATVKANPYVSVEESLSINGDLLTC